MSIWAIADLHLSFGVPNKEMDIFGEQWKGHAEKIKRHWEENILPEDLVLIAGDVSWAMNAEQVSHDLAWLERLPGTKVMVKGNHDYWWESFSKVQKILPPSCHVIQNNAFQWKTISIAGTRLWDTHEYNFDAFCADSEEPRTDTEAGEKIFVRELHRLEMSLKAMPPNAEKKIVMTHYPPISAALEDSRVSRLLEVYGINACVFGHLHNMKQTDLPFGEKNGIRYYLVACDYLHFKPKEIIL